MRNRIICFTSVLSLILCMILTLLPAPYLADTSSSENNTESSDTYVIPEDAIHISSVEELMELAENCRINSWSVGKTIVLSNDIDVSGINFVGIPTFGGVFLGQGHTIEGINITEKGSVIGFFRYLQETAIVDGLILEGKITPEGSKSIVGGFAGDNSGTIKNCTFSGEISGYENVGGFVGKNKTTGIVENCVVKGSVHGSHFVGGIAGENLGAIDKCVNEAEVNTKSVQNSVNLEDITIDNMINTESANTATDIGGIVGISSGIVRECINNGLVGYKNMGYNVGGIAGSQSGYLVDCVNNADIHGRKEVGGIVGHMEPNLVLEFHTDGLQILKDQMGVLGDLVKILRITLDDAGDKLSTELDALEKDMDEMEKASDILAEELDFEEIEKELENKDDAETSDNPEDIQNSLMKEYENLEKMLERLNEVDWDRVSKAITTLTSSSADAVERLGNISDILSATSDVAGPQFDAVMAQMEVIVDTVSKIEDNMGFEIVDTSGEDTEKDINGKVSSCINYGKITGEMNVGGIAGMLSDETDLDIYEDIETVGEESLHGTYKMRVVIRDCKNFGTIIASKQYAGGIAGQLIIGAVLESLSLGNMDAISADYVGGIAGDSLGIIRNCSSRSIIVGDTYVGGIAGEAKEVQDCYAFVSIVTFSEKAGAIIGCTEHLPEGTDEDTIAGNYYFVPEKDIGGIDGVSYTGATEKMVLDAFLLLPNLPEELRTVTLRFVVEGQEEQIFTINVGETFAESQVPALSVDITEEYNWKVVPQVTEKVLGMGETATVEYISEENLSNILFNQTYEATFDLKTTVIQGTEKNENSLSAILAEGVFEKNTTIQLEAEADMESFIENWKVVLSNQGVTRLHYLIPADMNADFMKLYVKNAEGKWLEREFTVDGSYIIFDFTDEDSNFALLEDYSELSQVLTIVGLGVSLIIVVVAIVKTIKKRRKR